MTKRIGLLSAGGDAPGLNVCLKAIVYQAVDRGYDVVGFRKGWEGLLHIDPGNPTTEIDHAMELTKARVRDIDRLAGSFLHSSRIDPAHVDPQTAPAFLRPAAATAHPLDLTEHLKTVVAVLQLDALILLGDNFSLTYLARLDREGVPVIGIPKSVHNDVNGSDYCLGFSTALARGVRFVHDLRAMAGSREEVAVVEMFGRSFGLTTLLIAVLASADRVLIPEVPFDPERLAALLMQDKRLSSNNYAILAMSEAVAIDPAQAARYAPEYRQRASARRPAWAARAADEGYTIAGERAIGLGAAGGGAVVTEILENLVGERMLFQPLTYLLRAGDPDGQDMLGAMNFATMAVELLAAGKYGRLVAYRRGENYVDLPIAAVTDPSNNVDVAAFYDAAAYRARPGIFWAARV
jgi:6-phosphofructokinase